jgi:hypothetical protein
MQKTTYWFEVSVSKEGGAASGKVKGLFGLLDKVHWVRKGVARNSYLECQADAIANGERPYRIKSLTTMDVPDPIPAVTAAAYDQSLSTAPLSLSTITCK